jgi:tetratricopeptide (TPR) repeat protein
MRAGLYHRQGKNDEAVAWCQRSLGIASRIDSREAQRVMAQSYYLQGAAQYRLADFDNALKACEESLRLYSQVEDLVGQARAYNNLAIVHSDLGDWEKSSEAYHKSLIMNQKIGNIQEQGFVANNLGNIHQYQGDWDRAVELYKESNAIWKKIGAPLPDAVTLSNLAQVHIYRENLEEALESLSQSQAIFESIGSEDFLPELERRWAEYRLRVGEYERALDHINRSVELASEQEARLELGMSLRVLGEIELALEELDSAEATLMRSLQILEDLKSEYQAAKTQVALVQLSILRSDPGVFRPILAEAIQTFEQLGAAEDLNRARDLQRSV